MLGIQSDVACVARVSFRQRELRNDFPQTGRAEVGAMVDLTHADCRLINKLDPP